MTLFHRFKFNVYLLVFLSFLGLTYAEGNPPLFFISLLALIVSWLLVEGRHGRTVPRWCINVGVLIASMRLFYELVILHPESLLLALGHFIVYILICKLFETKSARDYTQILTLSLLTLIIGSIFSSSLAFGVLFTLYLALGVYTIVFFHLRNEALAAHARGSSPPTILTDEPLREDLRHIGWPVGSVMVFVAVIAFLFFPRDRGRDMLGAWSLSSSNFVTGFSDSVTLEGGSPINQSDTVVMWVHIEQNGVSLGSAGDQPYFRGTTLDFYNKDDKQWARIPSNPDRISNTRDGSIELPYFAPNDGAARIKQTYTLFNPGKILFTIPEAYRVSSKNFTQLQRFGRENVLALANRPPAEFIYEVTSLAPVKRRVFFANPAVFGTLESGLMEPASLPQPIVAKARELAGSLLPKENSPPTSAQIHEIADRMVEELHTYAYTLDNPPSVNPNMDPTADFLVNRKERGGHCEYFASAMVLMCSALNIPARVATGYRGGTYNSVGDFYVVRQRNAHAWVEVYLPDEGWTTFDPTPATAFDTEVDERSIWITWSQELFQTLEHQWLTGVIGFDDAARRYLWDSTLAQMWIIPQTLGVILSSAAIGFFDLISSKGGSRTNHLVYIFALLALLTASVWLLHRLKRRTQSPLRKMFGSKASAQRRELAVELGFFDDLLRILQRTGIRRAISQTPQEYVIAACAGRTDAANEAKWLVQTFYELWFGQGKVTPQLKEKIDHSLKRLRLLLVNS